MIVYFSFFLFAVAKNAFFESAKLQFFIAQPTEFYCSLKYFSIIIGTSIHDWFNAFAASLHPDSMASG